MGKVCALPFGPGFRLRRNHAYGAFPPFGFNPITHGCRLLEIAVPTLKRRGIVTGGPPALYSAMWKRVRLRAGAAAAASHLRKKVAKGVALARRKKTLRPFAA